MPLTRIEAENFTVFEDITIPFSKGLNVLVGENGNNTAKISVESDTSKIGMLFSTKTKNGMRRLRQRRNGKSRCLILPAYLFQQKKFYQMPGIWMQQ